MNPIVYLPLDERPCNYRFPTLLADLTDLKLVLPPPGLMGRKKEPSDPDGIREWLLASTATAEYAILSIDQLVYGGIVPSRLHHRTEGECMERLMLLKRVKEMNPTLQLYAFNLIMRAPAYSSSEEEPEYYALFGSELCERGKLLDKGQAGLSGEERSRLDELLKIVPAEVIREFDDRRRTNARINEAAVDLANEGILRSLTIPLDDNAEFGFTSMEQRRLRSKVVSMNLTSAVSIYPGADEIGCTLFAKVFAEVKKYRPSVHVRYSSTRGPLVIPKYEDRSLHESVKAHLHEAGANMADHSAAAEAVLMVHAPAVDGPHAAEADDAYERRHRSYHTEINVSSFADALQHELESGKVVSLADVALSNGADFVLLNLLNARGLLPGLVSYAGWNTSGNSLGTVIAHTVIESYYRTVGRTEDSVHRRRNSRLNYLYRLLDDWAYQADIRKRMCENVLPGLEADYFRLAHVKTEVEQAIERELNEFIERTICPVFGESYLLTNVELPWDRMFELSFQLGTRTTAGRGNEVGTETIACMTGLAPERVSEQGDS